MFPSPHHSLGCIHHLIRDYPIPTGLLAALGGLTLARFAFTATCVFLQTFVLPGINLARFGARKGAWAVVTGATDGIGREFASQLAKAGFNVLIISRNEEKLSVVASEIAGKYNIQTKTHAIDFAKPTEKSWEVLGSIISGIEVGVLVNNVGRSHDIPVYFTETPQDEIDSILTININSTLRVTQIVLPSLLARKKGLILNIGSFAGAVPSPMLATYSGSKAFLSTWSQALAEELKSRGITVQLINTFFVVSAMSKIRKPTLSTPLPNAYVRSVLSHIGSPCGALGRPYIATPYWAHSLIDWVLGQIGLAGLYISYTHSLQKSIRARALRRRAREAESTKQAE
ncbi:3-ketoacyl-CoA reductase [Cantharellus anzutake]|uniref:3-ketoacyl-CoA reductase n=1 Tax=Cantharellus anzutake TaxID=1750568 RepID=UPI0019054BA2|nr:3-ketoacyl-CoA reductase [Cantharellus anzutake]KAF8331357.1 3-ketoacyl-CoA reductase [Cantharellus anzutake]